MYHLAGAANELLAQFTVAGEKCLIALDAVRIFLLQDVLLPVQGVLALCAVIAFRHFHSDLLGASFSLQNKTKLVQKSVTAMT